MKRKNKNFYVVWKGRIPGIYNNWEDCKKQVHKYCGAKYKGFYTQNEAIDAYTGIKSTEIYKYKKRIEWDIWDE